MTACPTVTPTNPSLRLRPTDRTPTAGLSRHSALARILGIAALNAIAFTHLLDLSHKLEERVAYMAALFSLLIVASVALAVALARLRSTWIRGMWSAGAALSLASLGGFVVSRTVGLPQMTDHIGDWTSPAGVGAVVAELLFIGLATHALRTPSRSRRRLTAAAAVGVAAAVISVALVLAAASWPGSALAHGSDGAVATPAAPAGTSHGHANGATTGRLYAESAGSGDPGPAATTTAAAPHRHDGPSLPDWTGPLAALLAVAFTVGAGTRLWQSSASTA